jgi:hypothetical protein
MVSDLLNSLSRISLADLIASFFELPKETPSELAFLIIWSEENDKRDAFLVVDKPVALGSDRR